MVSFGEDINTVHARAVSRRFRIGCAPDGDLSRIRGATREFEISRPGHAGLLLTSSDHMRFIADERAAARIAVVVEHYSNTLGAGCGRSDEFVFERVISAISETNIRVSRVPRSPAVVARMLIWIRTAGVIE